jgi:DNA-binding CsgD family transcriptional regulator
MYLSATRDGVLARVMATLAEPHERAAIRSRVGALMLDLLGAQHYASCVWNAAHHCFDAGVHLNMDAANLSRYEQYYQYRDPITRQLQQHRRAVRVTEVLTQLQLEHTEFFNDFLARDGLHWGVNLYAWSGERKLGDMRIWRDRRRENFSDTDLALLDLVRPALVVALQRCRSKVPEPAPRATPLSRREVEVAELAANGLHDKEIARRLGISVTTVRTHIEHAFHKLGVNSRVLLRQGLG